MTNELLNMEQLEGIAGGKKVFDDIPEPKDPQPIKGGFIPGPAPYEEPKPIPLPKPDRIPKPPSFPDPVIPYPFETKN